MFMAATFQKTYDPQDTGRKLSIKRSENIQDIFCWKSYVRSSYVVCPGGTVAFVMHKSSTITEVKYWLMLNIMHFKTYPDPTQND